MDGLGSFIKETRLGCFDRNVTLNDVSKHSGISQPYLSMVENEKKIPTVKTFFKIIETLARFGDNLYLGELDQEYNWVSWIRIILDNFLDEFSYEYKGNTMPNQNLSEQEQSIIEAIIQYREYDLDISPTEYLKQLKRQAQTSEYISDINRSVKYQKHKLDLNIFFNDTTLKNLDLLLDDLPISKIELEIIRNGLNGIRYTRYTKE